MEWSKNGTENTEILRLKLHYQNNIKTGGKTMGREILGVEKMVGREILRVTISRKVNNKVK